MATRQLLADLVAALEPTSGLRIEVESVGGVDAAKRVRAGEPFDVIVLAANVIDDLIGEGFIAASSRVDLVRYGVAVAVPAGAPRPDIGSEDAVRRAVEKATSLAYSTGPSGTHLARLFERWGLAASVESRLVRPPPGVPVGKLLAEGTVALGFQQMSELMNVAGIQVLGPLPPAIQLLTTFSAGVGVKSMQAEAVRSMLGFMSSAAAADTKIRNGMEPA